MRLSLFTKLAAALSLSLVATGAMAQDRMDHSTWEISGSYFRPKTELSLHGAGTITDGTTSESGSARGSVDDRFNGGQLEGIWRPTDRQRVVAGWYRVGNDKNYGLQDSGIVEVNPGETYDYAIDGRANWTTDFDLYRLTYGFDVYQNSKVNVTALIGGYGAKIKTAFRTRGTAIADGEAYDLYSVNKYEETKYAPGVGLSTEWRPADRWEVRASAEGFRTQWGDFDLDGHFIRAQAQVGYRFHDNWTGFAGYDWFELKLKDNYSGSGSFEGVDYAANGTATARLRVHGPVVGLRANF